jgi:hypothetical protein
MYIDLFLDTLLVPGELAPCIYAPGVEPVVVLLTGI